LPAQTPPPPPPSASMYGTTGPVGAMGSPVGNGVWIVILASIAYAGKRSLSLLKSFKEECTDSI
jgi:hypothetical protein